MNDLRLQDTVFFATLLAGSLLNVAVMTLFPSILVWGDEYVYALCARQSAELGPVAALPGFLPYLHRPSWACGLYSFLVPDGIPLLQAIPQDSPVATPWLKLSDPLVNRFVHRVAWLNLLCLAGLWVGLYALVRRIPKLAWSAAAAAALLYIDPRMMFHVQALWPELPHLALLAAGLAFATHACLADRPGLMLAAGLVFGLSMLIKGIVGNFLPLLAALALWALWRGGASGRRLGWHAAALLLGLAVSLGPQLATNAVRDGTLSLAHNSWRNIVLGLDSDPGGAEGAYAAGPADPKLREAAAREHTIRILLEDPWADIAARRLTRFSGALFRHSFFDVGLELGRWRNHAALLPLAEPWQWINGGLFVLGWLGMLVGAWHHAELRLAALYAALYSVSLALVGHNVRFPDQLLPFSAFFACLLPLEAWRRLRQERIA